MTGTLDKQILNHEQVANNFTSAIKKLGLNRVDAVISASESNSCALIGQLKLDMDKSISISIRVWNEKGSVAIANTSDSSINGIAAAAKTAYDLAELSENSDVLTYQPITGPEARHGGLNDSLAEISVIATELEENKKNLAEGVSPSYVGASHAHFGKMYIDGAGRYHLSMSSRSSVYVQAMVQTEKKPRTAKKHIITKDYKPENFGSCFKEASNKVLFHKHYKNVETNLYSVRFSGRAFFGFSLCFFWTFQRAASSR